MDTMVTVTRLSARKEPEWEQMKSVLQKAAPPFITMTENIYRRVWSALMLGEMEGWLFSDDGPVIIILTMVREDLLLDKKELIVYAAGSLRNMSVQDWDRCYEKLRLHALSKGCSHISAYTIVPRVMKMAKRMGGDIETRYVSIPLGGEDA